MRKIYLLSVLTFLFLWEGGLSLSGQNYSLYGVTDSGGTYGDGVLYRYDYPLGNEAVLINFNGTNGSSPDLQFALINNRYIYGSTHSGGIYDYGVIYRYDTHTGLDTVLFNFDGANGEHPDAMGLLASNGILYGETLLGGMYSYGTLFSFDPRTNVQTVLLNFHDSLGEDPEGFIIQASNGLIYGHTSGGGTYNKGVLFCYNINTGRDSVVLSFSNTNGTISRELFQATNGIIYGITQEGGTNNDGVLYGFNPTNGNNAILVNFGDSNGVYPSGYAYEASNGMLYGIAEMGGTSNEGLFFRYNINTGQDTIFYNFPASGMMGENPYSVGCIEAPGGILYIPISTGGTYGKGVLLTIDLNTNVVNKVFDFNGTDGSYPVGILLPVTCNFRWANDSEDISMTGAGNANTGNVNIESKMVQLTTFPNPNNGTFTLSLSNINENCNLEIYNVLGEIVLTETLRSVQGNNTINMCNRPNGIYFYRVIKQSGELVGSGKIIIEK